MTKSRYEDREDLRQDIILRLAKVASNNRHKPLTQASMLRVPSHVAMGVLAQSQEATYYPKPQ